MHSLSVLTLYYILVFVFYLLSLFISSFVLDSIYSLSSSSSSTNPNSLALASSRCLFSNLALRILATSALISWGSLGTWFKVAGSGQNPGMLNLRSLSKPAQYMIQMGVKR